MPHFSLLASPRRAPQCRSGLLALAPARCELLRGRYAARLWARVGWYAHGQPAHDAACDGRDLIRSEHRGVATRSAAELAKRRARSRCAAHRAIAQQREKRVARRFAVLVALRLHGVLAVIASIERVHGRLNVPHQLIEDVFELLRRLGHGRSDRSFIEDGVIDVSVTTLTETSENTRRPAGHHPAGRRPSPVLWLHELTGSSRPPCAR